MGMTIGTATLIVLEVTAPEPTPLTLLSLEWIILLLTAAAWNEWWRRRTAVYVSDEGIRTRDRRQRIVTLPWTDQHSVDVVYSLGLPHLRVSIPAQGRVFRVAFLAGTAARFVAAVENHARTYPEVIEQYRRSLCSVTKRAPN